MLYYTAETTLVFTTIVIAIIYYESGVIELVILVWSGNNLFTLGVSEVGVSLLCLKF